MGRDIEWEAEQYLLGRCAKCAEREKALQQARGERDSEVIGVLEALGKDAVRVHESGGPEDIYASLAVSVAKLQRRAGQVRQDTWTKAIEELKGVGTDSWERNYGDVDRGAVNFKEDAVSRLEAAAQAQESDEEDFVMSKPLNEAEVKAFNQFIGVEAKEK